MDNTSVKNNPLVWYVGGEDIQMRIPILKQISNMGFRVAAVGTRDTKLFKENEIPYYRYQLSRGFSPHQDLKTLKQLMRIFEKYSPDIVHAFDTKPGILVPIAAKKSKVKYCLRTVTGMGFIYSSLSLFALALRPIYRFLQRNASKASDITIFQNRDDMKYFQNKGLVTTGKFILIKGSGIDLKLLNDHKLDQHYLQKIRIELSLRSGVIITMVARLVKYKGVIEYLKAARRIKDILPELQFLLVGPQSTEGRQAVSLKEIRSYSDCVQRLGFRSDIPAILSLTDIFVLPTYYREGVPRALLEAGGLGVPTVTTDMPGCRDVVRDGVNGFLVPTKNVDALVDRILKLARSTTLRKKLGKKAIQHIENNFSIDYVATAYAKLYKNCYFNANN